ncbi:MAG: hypothetical protein LC126_29515 [Bryobacterales bacterium]|nr:hypothetical protein [Bryobacterales bacterium]
MGIIDQIFGKMPPPVSRKEVFSNARAIAAREKRQVVVIRPDLTILRLGCPPPDSMPTDAVARVEAIVPGIARFNIAVIAPTRGIPGPDEGLAEPGARQWLAAGKDIPFFGILNGLAYVGHAVWVFEGKDSEMEEGCRDADILIVDSALAESIPETSLGRARRVMRGSSLFLHDRETFQLRPWKAVQGSGPASWACILDGARRRASETSPPQIVLVKPDQSFLLFPCTPVSSMKPEQIAQAERITPGGIKRNIAVIAPTELIVEAADSARKPLVARFLAAGRTIPFFGLLLNLASIGNPMWIFDGRAEALESGCRDADLLVIDGLLADDIQMRTLDAAAKGMRSENVVIYDRNVKRLHFLRHVSHSPERIAYRD